MEILITLIFWIALAFWCYKIAENNGRDKGLAIILGLLFGILAVIIYAIIGKSQKKREEEIQKIVEERLKK